MCLFTIKFEGRRYNKAATLTLLSWQATRIEQLKSMLKSTEEKLANTLTAFNLEEEKRHKVEQECEMARRIARNFKNEADKLKEQLADFPQRGKGGKYVKRTPKKPV